ncbi:MAG: GntR family transcriptional regulator [Actinobacteria bacterium]|nr:GntR family transcriptional regulator [Actinomycetota bacterium]
MVAVPSESEPLLLSEQARLEIRDLIVTLELPPGAVISEADLMKRLHMGRTPVREALRALAHERLVDVYPRRGMFVAGIDARDLASLSEAREMLEPAAARLAAQRLADDDRLELDHLLHALDTIAGQPQGRDLMALDQRLHRFIYRCARNPFLEGVLDDYYTHALRIWFLALDRLEHLNDAVLEHRAILEAVRDGDEQRAADTMAAHIGGFETAIRRAL